MKGMKYWSFIGIIAPAAMGFLDLAKCCLDLIECLVFREHHDCKPIQALASPKYYVKDCSSHGNGYLGECI